VKLLVQRAIGALEKAFLTFDLRYLPPEKYLRRSQPAVVISEPATQPEAAAVQPDEQPLWQRIWTQRWLQVGVLLAAIGVLTVIFFFQDWLVRRPRLFGYVRNGFLLFTLVWLGWMVHAQPSVVNVLTFVNALITDFKWDYFLIDPLLFILWCSIAAALLFWG